MSSSARAVAREKKGFVSVFFRSPCSRFFCSPPSRRFRPLLSFYISVFHVVGVDMMSRTVAHGEKSKGGVAKAAPRHQNGDDDLLPPPPPLLEPFIFFHASFSSPPSLSTPPQCFQKKTHFQKLLDPPSKLVVVVRHELGELARAEGAELLGGRRRRGHRRCLLLLLLPALGGRGEVPGQDSEPLRHLKGRAREEREGGRKGTKSVEAEQAEESRAGGRGSLARSTEETGEREGEPKWEAKPFLFLEKGKEKDADAREKTMSSSFPVSLFVPHGAPTMAIERPPGPAAQALRKLGMEMTTTRRKRSHGDDKDLACDADDADDYSPSLVLVLASAHNTTTSAVSVSSGPAAGGGLWGTEHDFYGFPRELYEISYPVRGDAEVAAEAARLLERAGLRVEGWGEGGGGGKAAALWENTEETTTKAASLDHGAWTPLRLMFPDPEASDISVVSVSVQPALGPRHALAVGRALAPLARGGVGEGGGGGEGEGEATTTTKKKKKSRKRVVVLGSGNLTHNLRDWRRGGAKDSSSQLPPALPYVRRFAESVWERLRRGDVEALLQYREKGQGEEEEEESLGERAHPTEEHLLPLFVALGAAMVGDDSSPSLKGKVERFHSGVEEGILAMDGFAFF